ncbi:MAG TPA: glycosyltransferase [Pyrinomonadaceae bacterium]|nr:glycosyltransferase [Pyrinomonadaceae bacterium]
MVLSDVKISAIVPTIGRPESLRALLDSLIAQTHKVDEVIVADASVDDFTQIIVSNFVLKSALIVNRVAVHPPNAVRQRTAAINVAHGDLLLFLDDDVVLEPDCIEQLLSVLEQNDDIVAVTADFNNQTWPEPTRIWQLYLRHVLKLNQNAWQGRVVGPLLRFGYNPVPPEPCAIEWLGSGNSLVRRSAFIAAGGFSDFFLHRCTINEDVDLGLKLRRTGTIMFCPAARMAHHHAPSGRVTMFMAAEDDLFNRFFILRRTMGLSLPRSFGLVLLYFTVETTSQFLGCVRRLNFRGFVAPLTGRLRAFGRLLIPLAR